MFLIVVGIVFLCAVAWGIEPDPEPDPSTWYTIQAVTCVPGMRALPYLSTQVDHIRFAPGKWLNGAAHIRCAIPLQGQAYWNLVRVLHKDQDGWRGEAGVTLTLYRAGFSSAPEVLARLDSSNYPGNGTYLARIADAPILVPEFNFDRYVYWVDIALVRRTETTISPVVYAVELRYYASYFNGR